MNKKLLSLTMAAVMSLSAVSAMSAGVSAEWVKSSSGYSYKDDSTGKKLTGWQTIGSGKYYFNSKGIALTGWKKINGDTYYFNAAKKGKAITSWATIGGSKYYFGKDGVMRTGWIKLSGKTYYFGNDGKMRTGTLKISGKTYNFGKDGVLKSTASASSKSNSKLNAPMKNLKWGMSFDEVSSRVSSDVIALPPMLISYDLDTYKKDGFVYYLFSDDDELTAYGNMNVYSKTAVKEMQGMFTDDGWKYEDSTSMKKDGKTNYIYLYTKDNNVGCVMYNSSDCMTMVCSEELSVDTIDGTISTITGLS